jgi:hypothetical protein
MNAVHTIPVGGAEPCHVAMRCPHGCTPGRWLTDDEAFALISRVHQLSGQENVFTHDVDDVFSRAFPLH